MKLVLTPLFVSALFALGICYAQTSITVNLGEKASIPIKIDTTSTCNVEVTLAGKREQMTVEPTNPQLLIPFEGTELGVFDLKWEGKFRARGLKSVAACDGGGMVKVSVVPNTEQRRAEWVKFFANLPSDSSRQCVKVGLSQKGLVFESIDPQVRLESPSSPAARDVFAKCDSFFSARTQWGSQDKEDFPCTPRGGVRTRCRGVYAEQMPDGRLRTISFEEALKFHFEGRSWTTGVIETVQARIEREEQSRVAQERREAEIAANREAQEKARLAKIEADERERKYKESLENKKQQAESERQKAAEARAAEARAAEARAAEARAAEDRTRKERESAELAAKQQRQQVTQRQMDYLAEAYKASDCGRANLIFALVYSKAADAETNSTRKGNLLDQFSNHTMLAKTYHEYSYALASKANYSTTKFKEDAKKRTLPKFEHLIQGQKLSDKDLDGLTTMRDACFQYVLDNNELAAIFKPIFNQIQADQKSKR